jgi:two-component system, OmpR family, sensor histidine kinase KdpD
MTQWEERSDWDTNGNERAFDSTTPRATIAHVKKPLTSAGRVVVCALIVTAVVSFYKHVLHVNATTAALTFLLAVLVVSANWGFWYAAFLAVISTLAFNFYFLPPFGTFTIADPQNWVALFAFLATAVISGQLSERARRETLTANQRRREIEHLYAFSQRLLTLESVPEVLNRVPRHITETFACKGAAIFVQDRIDVYRSGPETREIDTARLQSVTARGEPLMVTEQQLAFVPLRLGVRSIGAIGISGTHLSHETMDALSTLVAIAMERTRAIENVGKAEAARENEKLRSAILDSIAHEFRTPLTAIKASVTTILSGGLDGAQQNELLTVVNEEADRMNHLVGEAMQLARLESKQVELDRTPHSVREAVDKAVDSAKKELANHTVEMAIPSDLPPAEFDLALIVNVLQQLLENAAKYSPPGSAIHISAESSGTEVSVSVADRGAGIDELEQALIFDKFYRGKDSRGSVQGTGMGLAIAKAVLDAHGGNLRVTSQLGQGSVFTFTLPLRPVALTR